MLGAALVVYFDSAVMLGEIPIAYIAAITCRIIKDCQSGPERPHSKGSADLNIAHASHKSANSRKMTDAGRRALNRNKQG